MLQIVACVFMGNQLVRYRISDGQAVFDLTRYEAWLYARDNKIYNVKAIGSGTAPGLTGINGFELKKLPRFRWQVSKTQGLNNNFKDSREGLSGAAADNKADISKLSTRATLTAEEIKKLPLFMKVDTEGQAVKKVPLKERLNTIRR